MSAMASAHRPLAARPGPGLGSLRRRLVAAGGLVVFVGGFLVAPCLHNYAHRRGLPVARGPRLRGSAARSLSS